MIMALMTMLKSQYMAPQLHSCAGVVYCTLVSSAWLMVLLPYCSRRASTGPADTVHLQVAPMRWRRRFAKTAACNAPFACKLGAHHIGHMHGVTRTYAGPQRAHAAEHAAPHRVGHVRPQAGGRPLCSRAALPDSRALMVQERLQRQEPDH